MNDSLTGHTLPSRRVQGRRFSDQKLAFLRTNIIFNTIPINSVGLMDKFKQISINIISSGFQERLSTEALKKIILMNFVCLTGIMVLIPMGSLAIFQKNVLLGLFDFIMASILIFNSGYLRCTGNYVFVSYFSIVSVMGLFLYLLLTGGVNIFCNRQGSQGSF